MNQIARRFNTGGIHSLEMQAFPLGSLLTQKGHSPYVGKCPFNSTRTIKFYE